MTHCIFCGMSVKQRHVYGGSLSIFSLSPKVKKTKQCSLSFYRETVNPSILKDRLCLKICTALPLTVTKHRPSKTAPHLHQETSIILTMTLF